ncbi:MAG: rRNA maturation RNase YbeY [Verrucomicrobiales bacterium]
MPTVSIFNRQAAHCLDVQTLESLAASALPICFSHQGPGEAPLAFLQEIEVSLVDDQTIAALHRQFLDDPSPTDVITFQHGEIIISVEAAAREAAARGEPLLREVALYLIHGLLHLNGHSDAAENSSQRMQTAQQTILNAVAPG